QGLLRSCTRLPLLGYNRISTYLSRWSDPMRYFARILALGAAITLIVYGMLQPVGQDQRWLLALWISAPLLLLFGRLALPAPPRGTARSLYNVGLVVAVGFGL